MKLKFVMAALLAAASLGPTPGTSVNVAPAERFAGGLPLCVANRCPKVQGEDHVMLAWGGLPLCVGNRCPKRKPTPIESTTALRVGFVA